MPKKAISMGFNETTADYTLEEAMKESARCYNCKHFPCRVNCPSDVRIPEFIMKVKDGDVFGAYDIISTNSNLPSMCGRLCPHEKQCQGNCVRLKVDGHVNIGRLERTVADLALSHYKKDGFEHIKKQIVNNKPSIKNTPKVAIIGSGPVGLSAANELAKNGIKSTVFEKDLLPGGVLRVGIPTFRLPDSVVDTQIEMLKAIGVEFRCGVEISASNTIGWQNKGEKITVKRAKELLDEYDYIILGQGVTSPIKLDIENDKAKGIMTAYEYLKQSKLNKDKTHLVGKNVMVIGGGNVATDVACTASKLESQNVNIVYRRTKNEMPAREVEVLEALHYGVKLMELTNPKRFVVNDDNRVVGMECIKMALGEADSSGRASPIEVKGSEFVLDCDIVVLSLGSKQDQALLSELGIDLEKGQIPVNENWCTKANNRIYACGDVATGALTVVKANTAGKLAARDIVVKSM